MKLINKTKNQLNLIYLLEQVEKKITKDEILNFFGDIENPNLKGDYLILKALLIIYDFQTEDEKVDDETKVYNNVGFSGVDAKILSSFAKQLHEKFYLSPKQMTLTRKKMRKYINQIIKLLNSNQISKNMDTSESRLRKLVLNKWYNGAKRFYDQDGNLKQQFKVVN